MAYALAVGVDAIEFDVGLTADGVVVLGHDQELSNLTISDTTPAWPDDPQYPYVGRRLRDLTLAQVKSVDAGTRRAATDDSFVLTQLPIPGTPVPTLAEVCALCASSVTLAGTVSGPSRASAYPAVPQDDALLAQNTHDLLSLPDAQRAQVALAVELKTDGRWPDAEVAQFVAAVTEVIDSYGLTDQTRLLGFDWRVLAHARRLAPQLGRVALVEGAALRSGGHADDHDDERGDLRDVLDAAVEVGATWFSPERTLLTPQLVRDAHERELPMAVWTVNDPVEMAHLIDLGVAAIVTDYPDRLGAVLTDHGLPRPRPAGLCDPVP